MPPAAYGSRPRNGDPMCLRLLKAAIPYPILRTIPRPPSTGRIDKMCRRTRWRPQQAVRHPQGEQSHKKMGVHRISGLGVPGHAQPRKRRLACGHHGPRAGPSKLSATAVRECQEDDLRHLPDALYRDGALRVNSPAMLCQWSRFNQTASSVSRVPPVLWAQPSCEDHVSSTREASRVGTVQARSALPPVSS